MTRTRTGATLVVYGRRGTPDGIALVIARAIPGAEVHRYGQTYRVSVASKRGMFRQAQPELVIVVDAGHFDGATADQRRAVLRDNVVRRIRGPGLESALAMIPELHLSVSFVPTDPTRPIKPTDPIFQVVLDVASRLDGFVFDLHKGRLFSMTGQLWGSTDILLADGGTPVDPSLARIHGRLVALVAVAARALTEYDGRDVQEAREGITFWVRAVGLGAELEELEEALLARPAGAMDDAELAHCSWQIEGAVVLAWSLDLLDDLPSFDEAVDPTLVSTVLRFPDAERTAAVLRSGVRRHQAIIDGEAERHYSIYWRLLEFDADREPLDLESFIASNPAGPLRFERVPLLGGDLAVGGRPLEYADPAAVDVAISITAERLRALSWLRAGGRYSATELGSVKR